MVPVYQGPLVRDQQQRAIRQQGKFQDNKANSKATPSQKKKLGFTSKKKNIPEPTNHKGREPTKYEPAQVK
jgi:hypothetical protein